ncbi:acyltransferase family protein [Hymenobacter properus]|uniref:Acyltransferase n=1 Tax=Hymenobacter properus TaxID=2791026 RepID=A0A931BGZ4_9BACT|nr:acyltransferase [Hymenobacter properus]MBF9143765.1 acyltransferase [Hymenobacter properus]MBR7722578.1 acyltransferase [Microvirga sp. SRT04]
MTDAKKDYFPALTGLRAVAAALVYVHHYNPFSPARFGWRIHNLAAETHIGVTVFFVLSGFLIGYRYLGRRVALRTYFANRVARIYPMYLLLTTLVFALLHYREGLPFSLGEYLLNITFLRGLFEQYVYSGIAQGWSLTVEEMFYLSAPLAFGLLQRSRQWLWALPLALVMLGAGLVVLCRPLQWHGFFGSFDFLFQFTYLGRAIEFFVGVGLAWWLRRTGTAHAPRGLTSAGMVGMLFCLGVLSLLHGPTEGSFGVFTPAGMFINNVALPVLGIAPLLWGLVGEATWVRRLLSSRLLALLGRSSYVFYLIHVGAVRHLLYQWIGSSVLTALSLWLVSILLYKMVEEPLNRWLRCVLQGSPATAPVLMPQ